MGRVPCGPAERFRERSPIDDIRLALVCGCGLGEGPLWAEAEGALWFVDVPRPYRLHRFVPETGEHAFLEMPRRVLSLAEREGGGLLVASARSPETFDPAEGRLAPILEPEPDRPGNRIDDGGAGPAGRFWFGTLADNFGPRDEDVPIAESAGSLHSYRPDEGPRRHDAGIGASNAISFAPGGRALYFADTLGGWIHRYDLDPELGRLGPRERFARGPGRGAPDGTLDRVVELPTRMVTSCAFGGPGLATLYFTTARFHLGERERAA